MDHLSEEEIIIDDPSSSDTESSDGLLHHQLHCHEAEADDVMQLNSSTDPLCNFEEQEKVLSTADIRHFFNRTLEETVSKYCKLTIPTLSHGLKHIPSMITCSSIPPTLGTSALHGHINRHHILEYLTLAEANKWQVWLESVKAIMARGYTLNEIWEALAEGRALASLPPRHSEASSTNSANPSNHPSIPPFSLEELHDHLVAFIIVDDQAQ
ncbi:hypothetical protein BDN67DRAFT_1015578 [Paxillus ammoniavirescens]|nr:hypothetical protein BDN67DRAFT_1015578 [Paxillus ammoniavirescens]